MKQVLFTVADSWTLAGAVLHGYLKCDAFLNLRYDTQCLPVAEMVAQDLEIAQDLKERSKRVPSRD